VSRTAIAQKGGEIGAVAVSYNESFPLVVMFIEDSHE
jgi:hypothetical protein